jgi:hypothetical protein
LQNFWRHSDQYLAKGHDTRIVHNARIEDLYYQLNNDANPAVIWISHATSAKSITGVSGKILDSNKIDVSKVFGKINKNIKWIGVVGCKALPLLQSIKERNNLPQTFYSFEKSVSLKNGFLSTVKGLKNFLSSNNEQVSSKEEFVEKQKNGIYIDIENTNVSHPLSLFVNNKFVALISLYNIIAPERFFYPLDDIKDLNTIKVSVESGFNDMPENELEELSLRVSGTSDYLKRTEINGIPIGGSINLYKAHVYKEDLINVITRRDP